MEVSVTDIVYDWKHHRAHVDLRVELTDEEYDDLVNGGQSIVNSIAEKLSGKIASYTTLAVAMHGALESTKDVYREKKYPLKGVFAWIRSWIKR